MVKKRPIRERMKPIIQALMKENKTYTELLKFGAPEKTLDRILKDYLEYWGLAYKKENSPYWAWYENKVIFQSGHDYDVALNHSKDLVLSTSEKQRFDQMDMFFALEMVVFHDIYSEEDHSSNPSDKLNEDDFKCVFQHLKSGYSEVSKLMKKYRKLMDKTGQTEKLTILKGYVQENGYSEPPLDANLAKELTDLSTELVGDIYLIVKRVKSGIPLLGFCDFCPGRSITIKDSKI